MMMGPPDQLRKVILSGPITEESTIQVMDQIISLECHDTTLPIVLYISTPGGSVYNMLSLIDILKTSSCEIHTVGVGHIMSAGVPLLASGDRGKRYIMPNASVMLHQVSSAAWGRLSDIEVSVKEARRLQELYINLLSKDTGASKAKIKEDIAKGDYFMNAQQALNYGIVDQIIKPRKSAVRKPTPKPKVKKTIKKVVKAPTKKK